LSNLKKSFQVQPVEFLSEGITCRGDLYLPANVENPAVVIMAFGFAGERKFRLPAYAEHFASMGLAVFLFDYRCFGDSEGEPRNYVDPGRHLTDWRAAINHVRSLNQVDGRRIGLWGTSFSGGHVIVSASKLDDIRAIVVQVPFVDSITTLQKLGLRYLLNASLHGIKDLFCIVTRGKPHYIKVIGHPGEFAALNTPDSYAGYLSIIPPESTWQNQCPARIVFKFPFYRPITAAAKVKCPSLFMLAENDSLINPAVVEETATRMPKSIMVRYPIGHFDIYSGEYFREAVSRQSEFLLRELH
jgi:dienelactone hydrolase